MSTMILKKDTNITTLVNTTTTYDYTIDAINLAQLLHYIERRDNKA